MTSTNQNKAVVAKAVVAKAVVASETTHSKSAMIHMVPITILPKVIPSDATIVRKVKLTPVKYKNRARRWGKKLKSLDLVRVRVPRPIKVIPESYQFHEGINHILI